MNQAEFTAVEEFTRQLQLEICQGLEQIDGTGRFVEDVWQRQGGGGGKTRVLTDGAIFEKAGVNWSSVEGELTEEFAKQVPGQGRAFRATGVSLVIHPRSPMIPTTHANFRFLQKGDQSWFGGGADLTPYYFFREDAVHFHRTLQKACDAHPNIGSYSKFKKECDEYFYLPHRDETRGVGGIFFDYLKGDFQQTLAFVQAAGQSFLPAYLPIVSRRKNDTFGSAERDWQLYRRGRYVEFNLLYDRGTTFGLKTNGRTESILMSLPPLVAWHYDRKVPVGSREEELIRHLKPIAWLD